MGDVMMFKPRPRPLEWLGLAALLFAGSTLVYLFGVFPWTWAATSVLKAWF